MKKWLLAAGIILVLLITSSYVFFPKEVNGSNVLKIGCNISSMNRVILVETKWKEWWPGKIAYDVDSQGAIFEYNGYQYIIKKFEYNAIDIEMQGQDLNVLGKIYFLPQMNDSIQVEWKYNLSANSNPVSRIHLYLTAKKINDNMSSVLKSMKDFMDKPENIYGMKINQLMVKDTILIFTEYNSPQYPSTQKIYGLIDGLKNYIASNDAKETNYPMLNVTNSDSGYFKVKVAIPVNKELPRNKNYAMRRMVPGKILVGEVTGGSYRARQAIRELGFYMADYQYSSPAIPFQSLVTNRMEEPDSSKWITKIYYPAF